MPVSSSDYRPFIIIDSEAITCRGPRTRSRHSRVQFVSDECAWQPRQVLGYCLSFILPPERSGVAITAAYTERLPGEMGEECWWCRVVSASWQRLQRGY
jgi:hypothetical protein